MSRSSSHDAFAVTKLREEIDLEVAALRERIRILHTKRNSLSLIYRLPSEILTRIFSCFQNDIVDTPIDSMYTHKKYIQWIVILQVSGYWRSLAISCKEIWSNIAVDDGHWIEMCYERSGVCDLSIKLDVIWANQFRLFKSAIREPNRIVSLELEIRPAQWDSVIPLLKFSAPNLKLLDLKARYADSDSEKIDCLLPVDLFCGDCPELQHLSIDLYGINLDAPLFNGANLTFLAIASPPTAIRMTDIILLLRRLPRLGSLSLTHSLTSAGIPHVFKPVHVPNLTYLELVHVGLETNTQFLRLITLSETADLRLKFVSLYHSPLPRFEDVMDVVMVKGGYQNPSLVFRDLSISWSTYNISMACMRNQGPRSGMLASPFVQIEFAFQQTVPLDTKATQWLLNLPSSFLAPVEVLRLENGQDLLADHWTSLAPNFPNLQHMIVGGSATSFMVDLNRRWPVSDLDQGPNPPIDIVSSSPRVYPALREVTLPLESITDAFTLRTGIASRKREGLGLKVLSITRMPDRPELRNQVLDVLRDWVEEIRWID